MAYNSSHKRYSIQSYHIGETGRSTPRHRASVLTTSSDPTSNRGLVTRSFQRQNTTATNNNGRTRTSTTRQSVQSTTATMTTRSASSKETSITATLQHQSSSAQSLRVSSAPSLIENRSGTAKAANSARQKERNQNRAFVRKQLEQPAIISIASTVEDISLSSFRTDYSFNNQDSDFLEFKAVHDDLLQKNTNGNRFGFKKSKKKKKKSTSGTGNTSLDYLSSDDDVPVVTPRAGKRADRGSEVIPKPAKLKSTASAPIKASGDSKALPTKLKTSTSAQIAPGRRTTKIKLGEPTNKVFRRINSASPEMATAARKKKQQINRRNSFDDCEPSLSAPREMRRRNSFDDCEPSLSASHERRRTTTRRNNTKIADKASLKRQARSNGPTRLSTAKTKPQEQPLDKDDARSSKRTSAQNTVNKPSTRRTQASSNNKDINEASGVSKHRGPRRATVKSPASRSMAQPAVSRTA